MPAARDERLRNRYGIVRMDRVQGRLRESRMPEREEWHAIGAADEPAFQNSWAAGLTVPGFWRDAVGIVHLRGLLTGTTLNTTAFTLPEGYRPGVTRGFLALSGTAAAEGWQVNIEADGDVIPAISTGTAAQGGSLDGIHFRADDAS